MPQPTHLDPDPLAGDAGEDFACLTCGFSGVARTSAHCAECGRSWIAFDTVQRNVGLVRLGAWWSFASLGLLLCLVLLPLADVACLIAMAHVAVARVRSSGHRKPLRPSDVGLVIGLIVVVIPLAFDLDGLHFWADDAGWRAAITRTATVPFGVACTMMSAGSQLTQAARGGGFITGRNQAASARVVAFLGLIISVVASGLAVATEGLSPTLLGAPLTGLLLLIAGGQLLGAASEVLHRGAPADGNPP